MTNITSFFYATLCVFVLLSCSNEHSNSNLTEPISKAEQNYIKHCSSCHGKKGDAQVSGAANLRLLNRSEEEIYNTINDGKRVMPSYKGILTEEEILELSQYVLNIRND